MPLSYGGNRRFFPHIFEISFADFVVAVCVVGFFFQFTLMLANKCATLSSVSVYGHFIQFAPIWAVNCAI